MSKRKKIIHLEFIDKARERMLFHVYYERAKNVLLFLIVSAVLTWLVVGVF